MIKVLPMVMQKPQVPVEVLDAILDEGAPVPSGWIRLDDGDVLEVLRMTELRRNPGGFLDNVRNGRRLAVARKGKLLAILEPPPKKREKMIGADAVERALDAPEETP